MRGYDYYELLGISRDASAAEVRSAYRSLAKRMHPDAGGTAGAFRLVREAYETLSDPESRAEYDASDGEDGPEPEPPRRARWAEREHTPSLSDLDTAGFPWWRQVRPDEPVVLSPTAGPPPRVVGVAGAGWAGAALGLLFAGVPALVLAGWLVVLAVAGAVVLSRYLAARAADRAFLAEVGSTTVFGRPGEEPDEVGERLTAELLERYLTRIPAVRICHGLAAETGSVFADIHHAVLCGRRLVLVESKLWLPGHYRADGTGALWRNGHRFRGGASDLRALVEAYRRLLPGVEVRGALLLYPSRPGGITTEEDPADVAPTTPERFVREVGTWLAADPYTVDRDTLRTVVSLTVRQ